jgi:hypothetical protein
MKREFPIKSWEGEVNEFHVLISWAYRLLIEMTVFIYFLSCDVPHLLSVFTV